MKFIIIILFCSINLLAQSIPSYTSNYRLRMYAQGANPSADSLNANWSEIDALFKIRADSISAHRTGLSVLMDSIAAHRAALGTGSNMDLSTNQTASGTKTFSGTLKSTGTFLSEGVSRFKADTVVHNAIVTPGEISLSGTGTFIILQPTAADEIFILNGGSDGNYKIIINQTTSVLTFKDGVDNLYLAGDFAMGQYDVLVLIYESTVAKWIEISRSNN